MKKLLYVSFFIIILSICCIVYLTRDYKHAPATTYINGHIITLNEQQPVAEAMIVQDGLIKSIGTLKEIEQYQTAGIHTIDLGGATVMPGFIDVHSHFALSMFLFHMHDLSGFKHKSNEEVWKYFEDIVKKTAKDKWIVCKGLDPILVKDLVMPTLEYLNRIAPDNPVLIFSQSLHSYWANSVTFNKAGIVKDTPNPSKNSYYEKDSTGELTGLIVEQEAFKPILELLKKEVLTSKLLSNAASKVMSDYAKNGNTTVVSAGITINDSKSLILFKHLSDEKPSLLGSILEKTGTLPVRKPLPRHFLYMRHDMAQFLPSNSHEQNDFYKIIGIKHWYDGSPYSGSMYIEEPYVISVLSSEKLHIPKGYKGEALITKETLKEFIKKYHSNGWQIAIHTQGDAAIKKVLDIFEELEEELDFNSSRHRLEHCLLLPRSELDRMKRLNITPSFHINHLYFYGEALKFELLGDERTQNILPVASTGDKNIKYSLHADQPMFESLPFRLIQTAIERKTKSGIIIGEEQKIALVDAIEAMTINAAWQINMEEKIGSLEKGKYADFIILDKNPFEVPVSELQHIKCLKTFVSGNQVTGY